MDSKREAGGADTENEKATSSGAKKVLQIKLPRPMTKGAVSLEEAISSRESFRQYSANPINLKQLSQILWAAQGVTHDGMRSAPSAGALYPMEIYVVARTRGVEGLLAGIYRYDYQNHAITLLKEGDFSQDLQRAASDQESVGMAASNIVIIGIFERTTAKYGERGVQYVFQESGHISENIFLQAAALGLGSVAMGAFRDNDVRRVLGVARNERPIYIQPIGVKS
ncbi:MAG TPA: SagB/ThcOx family dehydrogenase [Nitrososphaerales archaeon]|nr:SagB/ThcOx family dehydrogenase [Nitrososphaerales archaeon]